VQQADVRDFCSFDPSNGRVAEPDRRSGRPLAESGSASRLSNLDARKSRELSRFCPRPILPTFASRHGLTMDSGAHRWINHH
jgi:hypothetical protein